MALNKLSIKVKNNCALKYVLTGDNADITEKLNLAFSKSKKFVPIDTTIDLIDITNNFNLVVSTLNFDSTDIVFSNISYVNNENLKLNDNIEAIFNRLHSSF